MQVNPELIKEYDRSHCWPPLPWYSNGIVTFAQRWAELLEKEIARRELIPAGPQENWSPEEIAAYLFGVPKVITECAKATMREADNEGITGNQYGEAVSFLNHFWVHGRALARWHNRQYLSEEEAAIEDVQGGVVNPAWRVSGQ